MHDTDGTARTRTQETIGRTAQGAPVTATAGLPLADLLADPQALAAIAEAVKQEWHTQGLDSFALRDSPAFFTAITTTVLRCTAAWGENLPTGKASTEGVVRDGMRAGA